MGMWGVKIGDSDGFLDTKEMFFNLYDYGMGIDAINDHLIKEQKNARLDGGELHEAYFALAECGWTCGILAPTILTMVKNIIVSGENLTYLKEMGMDEDDLKDRAKELDSFLEKLNSKNPQPLKRDNESLCEPYLASGDVFVAEYLGKYHPGVVLWKNDVIFCHNPPRYKDCHDLLIAFSDLVLERIPTVDEVINSDVFYVSWHTFNEIPPQNTITVIDNIKSKIYDKYDYRSDFGARITPKNFHIEASRQGDIGVFAKQNFSKSKNTLDEIKGKKIKDLFKKKQKSDASKKADIIQKAIDKEVLKGSGFVRKGRNYNRKTADGLTQIITFIVYKKYESDPTILNIEVGIHVPEVCRFNFDSTKNSEQFYSTSCCNVFRSEIGCFMGYPKHTPYKGYGGFVYIIDRPDGRGIDGIEDIISQATEVLKEKILPMFDDLNSRDRIIEQAEKYPLVEGRWNLAKACIYGARGEIDKARACCCWTEDRFLAEKARELGLMTQDEGVAMDTQIKANFFKYKKKIGVVEIFIENEFEIIKDKLSDFTIEDYNLERSYWQVLYMEQYFSADRATKLCETSNEPSGDTKGFNIVFFIWNLEAGQIMRTPFGSIKVTKLKKLPAEYKKTLEFDEMD